MSREIKFRAWDKVTKTMVFFGPKYFLNDDGYLMIESPSGQGPVGDHDQTRFSSLMQFTGHNDKNEREIYEGDILKHDPAHKSDGNIEIVEWINSNCLTCAGWFALNKNGMAAKHTHLEHVVVIGNKYANPDLLANDRKQEVT